MDEKIRYFWITSTTMGHKVLKLIKQHIPFLKLSFILHTFSDERFAHLDSNRGSFFGIDERRRDGKK